MEGVYFTYRLTERDCFNELLSYINTTLPQTWILKSFCDPVYTSLLQKCPAENTHPYTERVNSGESQANGANHQVTKM